MRPVIAKRQGTGSTVVRAAVLSLALMVGVLWFLGDPGQVHACKCAQPGTPSEELEKFSAVFAGRAVSIQHSYDPMQRLSPLRTAPRLPSRSALCGRALSTRTCPSPLHQPAAAAGSPLSKGRSTSSTVTTVIMLTADTLLAYAVGPPSLGKRKPTSTLSGGECSSSRDRRTSARRTTRHATSKYRRLQPTGLGNSPGRGNRRSPGGWRRGPNGPQSTTQPT